MSLECVDNIEGGDGLSLGVFSVGNGVANNVFEEASEDVSSFLIDERGDSLDTSTSGESSDGGLGDAHDGFFERFLGVALGTNLSVSLSNFTSSGHFENCFFFFF